ncbi:MAG: PAS domain S-box protein, partial [Flavobacteriales bacterium]
MKHSDSDIDFELLFESSPGLFLVLLPDLKIVAVSDAYAEATMTKRETIVGRGLFDVFPDNPDDETADGVTNLRASLNAVIKNKTAHTMAVQKYDIKRPDGTFEERFWSPLNKPVLNEKKEIVYIIHRVEDVTDFVRVKAEKVKNEKLTDDLRQHVQEMETFKRAQEIQKMNTALEQKSGIELQVTLKEISDYKYALDESAIVAITDQKGIITHVNKNFCNISKYSEKELIGQDHRII